MHCIISAQVVWFNVGPTGLLFGPTGLIIGPTWLLLAPFSTRLFIQNVLAPVLGVLPPPPLASTGDFAYTRCQALPPPLRVPVLARSQKMFVFKVWTF